MPKAALLNAESLDLNPDYEPPKGTPSVHSLLGDLYLPLEGLIDVEAEKLRLTKELAKALKLEPISSSPII